MISYTSQVHVEHVRCWQLHPVNTRVSENQRFCSMNFMNHEKHRKAFSIIACDLCLAEWQENAAEREELAEIMKAMQKHSAWQHGLVMLCDALCTCFTLKVNLVIFTKNFTAPAMNLSASEYCNGFLHSQSFVNSASWKMHENAEHGQTFI